MNSVVKSIHIVYWIFSEVKPLSTQLLVHIISSTGILYRYGISRFTLENTFTGIVENNQIKP